MKPLRTIESVKAATPGLVCVTVVDEHLNRRRVLVRFQDSTAEGYEAIVDRALDARPLPNRWKGVSHG